jgi:hypothetical protein
MTMKEPVSTTTNGKRQSLVHLAREVSDVIGDGAECGVFQGGCLRAIAEVLPYKRVYGFDTFCGLPQEAWSAGELHNVGDFSNSSLDLVQEYVGDLANVWLRPGLFPESAAGLENSRFAFVYVDFDFYLSTLAAIEWFRVRMSAGGVMVFDDYNWPYCPGVKRAIEEYGLVVHEPIPYQAVVRF